MSTDKSRFENSIRYEVALEDGRTSEYWSTAGAASSLDLDVIHVTGKNSIAFDKISGGDTATIHRNPASMSTLDLNMFSLTGYIYIWVYLSSVTDISSLDFYLGTDSTDNFKWSEPVASLEAGWNKVTFKCTESTQQGDGINWFDVNYMALSVVFGSGTDTLSGILLDSVTIQNPLHNYGIGGEISIDNSDAENPNPNCVKLVDVTNGLDNTYYYPFDMRTYKFFGVQFILNGGSGTVTCTVEISAMCDVDDATAQYETISFPCKEEFTLSDYAIADTPIPARYGRIKVVVDTSGANDASWKIYLVKIY